MISVRKASDRGSERLEWLSSYHSFSFGTYFDRNHMCFGALRVINEDRVQPGTGFGWHPHRDMEILTYVLEGAIEHRDSIGNRALIQRGDIQLMSAGTGIVHSEYNPSNEDATHFLQIWIEPSEPGTTPRYEQRTFTEEERTDQLRVIASPNPKDEALHIGQDVRVLSTLLTAGKSVRHRLPRNRQAWLQVASGSLELNGQHLGPGDGASTSDETALEIVCEAPCDLILFELA